MICHTEIVMQQGFARLVIIIVIGIVLLFGFRIVSEYFSGSNPLKSEDLPKEGKDSSSNISYQRRHEDLPAGCTSTDIPKFTHDITDTNKIVRIIPPVGMNEREELKPHSYLHITESEEMVPVFAPTDGVLAWGTFVVQQNRQGKFDKSIGTEYALFIEIDCNHYIFLDHISNPVEKIRQAFPSEPATNSQTQNLPSPVSLKAGEKIAQTTGTQGGIWDFGVFDRRKKLQFPDDVKDIHQRHQQASCPYGFYDEEKRNKYEALYDRNYPSIRRVLEICN